MKMDRQECEKSVATLAVGTLDVLRGVVEWLDDALSKNTRRDFEFNQKMMEQESSLLVHTLDEITDRAYQGTKGLVDRCQKEWGIFSDTSRGSLKLNYENFAILKSILKKQLANQPFGYSNQLERPRIKPETRVLKRDEIVYIQYNEERPIPLARANNNQGKLLLLLGNPFGQKRTIRSVLDELGADSVATVENAVKEMQRKLARKRKSGTLRLRSEQETIWLEQV